MYCIMMGAYLLKKRSPYPVVYNAPKPSFSLEGPCSLRRPALRKSVSESVMEGKDTMVADSEEMRESLATH